MDRTARLISTLALTLLATQSQGCVYSARGRGFAFGQSFRFHVRDAPCPEALAPMVVVPAPPGYVPLPPLVYAPPPVAYVQPPMAYAAPPMVYSPPPPPPPAPQVVVVTPVEPPPKPERQALVALKYAPGASAPVAYSTGQGPQVGVFALTQSLGAELRVAPWFALRSDYEWRPEGRTWDLVGAKVSPFPDWALKPYGSVSLSGSEAYALPGQYQLGVSGALGFDIPIGRHFFIEAEARYRVTPTDCCRAVPHLTALAGAGVAFF
jgi:hypothetical protein